MKMPARLSKTLQYFGLQKKPIDMAVLYKIIGHVPEGSVKDQEGHPIIPKSLWSNVFGDLVPDEDAYVRHIEYVIKCFGMEKNIKISKNDGVFIAEKNSYYRTKYKITIKKFAISTTRSNPAKEMIFDQLVSSLDKDPNSRVGIYLIFEKNDFVGSDRNAIAEFCSGNQAYLIFRKNKFISGDIRIKTNNSSKIELTSNKFKDSVLEIIADSNSASQDVVCIESNTFSKKQDISSKLIFDGKNRSKCRFKGKNTLDNLVISENSDLHWGGYQNIDPKGKHAYTHKTMFINFIKKAVEKNDKIQEAQLRKELLKCERALIRDESFFRSLQDRFILGWSSWISDYGISWFRPFRFLVYMNTLLALAIVYFFNLEYSLWLLFFEFFNPLSSLSDMENIKGSKWIIAAINVVQKAFLALFLYEIIKIFRRFSK